MTKKFQTITIYVYYCYIQGVRFLTAFFQMGPVGIIDLALF